MAMRKNRNKVQRKLAKCKVESLKRMSSSELNDYVNFVLETDSDRLAEKILKEVSEDENKK